MTTLFREPLDIPRALRLLPRRTMPGAKLICKMFDVPLDRFDDILDALQAAGLSVKETLTPEGAYFAHLGHMPVGAIDLPARYPAEVLAWARERGYIADDARMGGGRKGTPKPAFRIVACHPLPEVTLADHR